MLGICMNSNSIAVSRKNIPVVVESATSLVIIVTGNATIDIRQATGVTVLSGGNSDVSVKRATTVEYDADIDEVRDIMRMAIHDLNVSKRNQFEISPGDRINDKGVIE